MLVVLVFFVARALTRQKLPIRVATVVRDNLVSELATNGKVEPLNSWEAHAPVAGQVTAVLVHEGESVEAGELLMALDETSAKAQVASAEAALKGAEANLAAMRNGGTQEELQGLNSDLQHARTELQNAKTGASGTQQLAKSGAASPAEVAAANQRLSNARQSLSALELRKNSRYSQADIAHAEAQLNDARAGFASAQKSLAECQVRAPFSGTVYSIGATKTEFVDQGKLLLQVADLSDLQVRAYFDEPEIGRLKFGQPAKIVWDAKPGREWHGEIIRLPSNVILYGTRNVGEATIALSQDEGDLLPNTNVTVTITLSKLSDVLTIPRDALRVEKGQNFVLKLEDDRLVKTPITIAPGGITLTRVAVSSGLAEKDIVALSTLEGQTPPENVPVKAVP